MTDVRRRIEGGEESALNLVYITRSEVEDCRRTGSRKGRAKSADMKVEEITFSPLVLLLYSSILLCV